MDTRSATVSSGRLAGVWFGHLNGYFCFSFWSISPRETEVTHLGYYYTDMCERVRACIAFAHRIYANGTDAVEVTRFIFYHRRGGGGGGGGGFGTIM